MITNQGTETHTLQPGLLVALSTSVRGNTRYFTTTIEGTHLTENGEQRASWQTERVVADPEEYAAASKVQSQARNLIVKVCIWTAFGLLCPEDRVEELIAAMNEARALADAFNADAKLTRVQVNTFYARIARDDEEAARAITAEVRSLMEDMRTGLEKLDVKAVRNAANRARETGQILSEEAQGRLQVAIDAARAAARKIVKAGETVGLEIDRQAIAQIDMARTSFLDIEEAAPIEVGAAFDRAIDFEADFGITGAEPVMTPAVTRDIEIV